MATPPMYMAMRTTHVRKCTKAGCVRWPCGAGLSASSMTWSEVTYDAFIRHPLTMVVCMTGSVSTGIGRASAVDRTHLQHTSSTNGTVVCPFRLSSPTLLAPFIGCVEVICHRCHEGLSQAGLFAVTHGVLWGRDRSRIASEAHNE
jgi:hypothetical protein